MYLPKQECGIYKFTVGVALDHSLFLVLPFFIHSRFLKISAFIGWLINCIIQSSGSDYLDLFILSFLVACFLEML